VAEPILGRAAKLAALEEEAAARGPDLAETLAIGETCRTADDFIAYSGRAHLGDLATGKIVKTTLRDEYADRDQAAD